MGRLSTLGVLCLLAWFAAVGQAQVTTATIHGIVLDASGAVVPGARVTVTSEQTVLRQQSISDAHGEITITFLPVGTYSVSVGMDGFKALPPLAFLDKLAQFVAVLVGYLVGL